MKTYQRISQSGLNLTTFNTYFTFTLAHEGVVTNIRVKNFHFEIGIINSPICGSLSVLHHVMISLLRFV